MKTRKILIICLAALFAAAGCSAPNGGRAANTAAGSEPGSSFSSNGPVMNVNKKANSSEDISQSKNRVRVKYYDTETNVSAYKNNENVYMNLNDISSLFQTKITYNKTDDTVFVGDGTRASANYYMPDVSSYPNLDSVIELPPYEVWTDGGVVEFRFITKAAAFSDMIPKIDKALKTDGFTVVTKEQYTVLTKSRSEFKKGEMKNTYIKYKQEDKNLFPNAIQIVDGGVNKNKLPIIVVRMSGD